MKTLNIVSFCLTVLLISQSAFVNADDLFSNKGVQNVFKNIEKPNSNTQAANNQITNNDLGEFVKAMGYETKDLKDGFFLVKVAKDDWTFEPVISLSKASTHLWVSITLKTYKDNNFLGAENYMNLLDANLTYGPVVFNYNKKTSRITLTRSFLNKDLLPAKLKGKIIDMCDVGVKTVPLWNIKERSTSPISRQTNKPKKPYWFGKNSSTNNSPNTKKQGGNPVGQWMSKKINDELFGLQFNADGSYLYIFQKGTNQTETKGRYGITNNVLTMTSDAGEKLEGTLVWKSEGTFNFITLGAAANATGIQFDRVVAK